MIKTEYVQATIWGTEEPLSVQIERRVLRIRPKHQCAPLFDHATPVDCPAGVPHRVFAEFLDAAQRHAERHPNASPLTFSVWYRRGDRPGRGRPTDCPDGRDPSLHAAYKRSCSRLLREHREACAQSGNETPAPEMPSFEAWLKRAAKYREQSRASSQRPAGQRQVVKWVVIVPRREMVKNPEIEREWNARLYRDESLAKTHRMSLLGVQRRVS